MQGLETLDPVTISIEEANRLWDRVRHQEICFDDFTRDNADLFAQKLVLPTTAGFLYKDAVLVLMEQIIPKLNAYMHFFLFDTTVADNELATVGRHIARDTIDMYQLHRITATPPSFNKRAVRIATRVGFRYEGLMKGAFLYKGHYHDLEIRGLLAEDLRRLM